MPVVRLPQPVALRFRPDQPSRLRENLSGIRRTPDGGLWVASDESNSLDRLTPQPDGSFAGHQHYPLADFFDLPDGPDEEADLEGLAYDDPYLWVVGSHSRKLRRPKGGMSDAEIIDRLRAKEIRFQGNRCLLGRVPLIDGTPHRDAEDPARPGERLTAACLETGPGGDTLTEALGDDPHLAPFVAGLPGKANGLDVEGLEVRGGRVFLGLRGPVLLKWAVVLELEAKAERDAPHALKLKKIGADGRRYRKHFVNLDGLGVRDLCWRGDDLLILAGPTMDLDGPARLYRMPGAAALPEGRLWNPELLGELPAGPGGDHPEGVCPFPGENGASALLVVYDSPLKDRLSEPQAVTADLFRVG